MIKSSIVALLIAWSLVGTAKAAAPSSVGISAQVAETTAAHTEEESLAALEADFKKQENTSDKIGKSDPLKESEIPVLSKKTEMKAEASNPFVRMIIAVIVVLAMGAGALVYAKKYRKMKVQRGPAPQIQVLTQHYLGPKKSLAIIKVAGESILIGMTDHSITPIRVLALLDDELPTQTPDDFNAAMTHVDFAGADSDEFQFHSSGLME